jgi:hypothetical protein
MLCLGHEKDAKEQLYSRRLNFSSNAKLPLSVLPVVNDQLTYYLRLTKDSALVCQYHHQGDR